MPWHVAKSDQCPASKPWAVIKNSDGTIAGCHETESKAEDQVAALYANEKDASPLILQRGRVFSMPQASFLNRKVTRSVPMEFRAVDDHPRRFLARVIRYNIVDDYDTEFDPLVFEESLQRRLPRVVWSHDWSEPLGRYIEARNSEDNLDLVGEFDDFDDVPRARQAYSQLRSGTIDEFSVGFMPLDGKMVDRDGKKVFRFTRARLDEVSLVLAGAVPGTELLAVRSKIQVVRGPVAAVMPKDQAAQIILDMHEGRMDIADALMAIKTAQSPESEDDDSGGVPETPPAEPPVAPSSAPPSPEAPSETSPSVPPAGTPPEPVQPAEVPTPAEVPAPAETPPAEDYSDVESILLQHL